MPHTSGRHARRMRTSLPYSNPPTFASRSSRCNLQRSGVFVNTKRRSNTTAFARTVGILALGLLSAGCSPHRVKPALPGVSGAKSDGTFLLLIFEDSAKAQAIAESCSAKHIQQDIRALCSQIINERRTEADIAASYLSRWFNAPAPNKNERLAPDILASADGMKFQIVFLGLMVRQDNDELGRYQACVSGASRPQVVTLCETLRQERSVEIQVMRMQLCLQRKDWDCRSDQHDESPRQMRRFQGS